MKRNNILFAFFAALLTLTVTALCVVAIKGWRYRSPIPPVSAPVKYIALTFDDGPNPRYTSQVLNILHENQAQATFFVNGKNMDENKTLLRQIVRDGHELGNHSYHHYDLTTLSKDEITLEIQRTQEVLEQILPDYTLRYVRPPYGRYNRKVCRASPLPIILWDIDSGDWEPCDWETIYQTVMESVQNASIIVFHDDNPATVQALRSIIPQLREMGYAFVTLSDFFQLQNSGGG